MTEDSPARERSDERARRTRDYRAWVGPAELYDVIAALQFSVLTHLGLREHHHLLDVGCGSLRAGRLLIPYLAPGRYFGIEPETWLIEEALEKELGRGIVAVKRPTFSDVSDFRLSVFGRTFDYVVAQSIFSHAGRRQVETCIAEAARVLEPGGAFAATYFEGDDHTGDEWVYPDPVSYRAATLRKIARDAGLELRPLEWPHPRGQRWVVMFRQGAPGPSEVALDGFVGLREQLDACRAELERIQGHLAVRLYTRVRRRLRGRR